MAELDYYKVLGVPSSSRASEIRKRYQQLAKQHHPDHQGDESSMIIINRAYEILSNSSKRIEYDHLRGLRRKRLAAASNTRQHVQTSSYKTQKAEVTNNDLIVIGIFIVLLLVTMLGLY